MLFKQVCANKRAIEVYDPVVYDELNMTNIQNTLKYLAIFGVIIGLIFVIDRDRIHADAGGTLLQARCDESRHNAAFAATQQLPKTSYKIYVRLEKAGQTAPVEIFATDGALPGCRLIGSVTAESGKWTEVGIYLDDIKGETIFHLYSSHLSDRVDANRPSLLLVDQANEVCTPDPDCRVTIGNETGTVVPPSTLLNQSSLRLVRVIDPELSEIKEVRYYVDDKLAYTTASLETFDLRYVLHGGQKLNRVIEYTSGQLVVFEDFSPDGYVSAPQDYIYSLFNSNSGVISGFAWLVALTVFVSTIRTLVHLIQKRQQWRYDHGFAVRPETHLTEEERRKFYAWRRIIDFLHKVTLWLIIGTVTVGCMIILNLYIIRFYKVDGSSMEATIQNGTWQVVNRVPKTLSYINGLEYIPKRGEVVVIDAVYGITNKDTAEAQAQTIIKRVIGLPGERIVVRDGDITIYNTKYPMGFSPDQNAPWSGTMRRATTKENIDLTLKTGELFVIGDNRPGSIDSRYNGPVNTRNVVGPLLIQPK